MLRIVARLLPYVLIPVMIAFEGLLVVFIVSVIAPTWLGMPGFGGWLAWILFILGGYGLGLIELVTVRQGEELKDPLHVLYCWLQRKLGTWGYIINSIFFGSMGASIALKREGVPHQGIWSFLAAILFATVWIPLYLTVLE